MRRLRSGPSRSIRPSSARIDAPWLGLLLLAAAGVHAEPPDDAPTLAASSPRPSADSLCVQVSIGPEQSSYLDCLNAELQRTVNREAGKQELLQVIVNGAQPTSPTELGLYNQTATRERLGNAFGHSVIPQRPPRVYPPHFPLPQPH